jgi:tetratricopeptide (TPR) repeat protein
MNSSPFHLVLALALLHLVAGCSDEHSTLPDPSNATMAPDVFDPAVQVVIQKRLEAIKRNPGSATAQRSLGLAFEANSAWPWAIGAYRRTLAINPDDHAARLHLAICLAHAGEDVEHVEQLEIVVKAEPTMAAGLNLLGLGYLNAGRFQEAQAQFLALRSLVPDLALGHLGMGQVLLEKDEAKEALKHLRKAHDLAPDDLFVGFVLGQCLADIGHNTEALPYLSRANDPRQLANLGIRGLVIRPPLVDTLTKELGGYGVSLTAQIAQASRHLGAGNRIAALSILEDLEDDYPDDLAVLNNLGAVYIQVGQDEDALRVLHHLLTVKPDHHKAWFNISSIHYDRGVALLRTDRAAAQPHLGKALSAADKAVTHGRHVARMHNQRGNTLMALNNPEEAVAEYHEAIRLGSTDETVYLKCSQLSFMQGHRSEGFEVLMKAAQTHPEWFEVRIQIVPYYVGRQDSIGARSLMAEIKNLAPEDPRLTNILNLIVESGL